MEYFAISVLLIETILSEVNLFDNYFSMLTNFPLVDFRSRKVTESILCMRGGVVKLMLPKDTSFVLFYNLRFIWGTKIKKTIIIMYLYLELLSFLELSS